MEYCCLSCFFCFVRLYNRFFYKKLPKQKISTSNLPWLWVGAELTNNKIETVTELINHNIQYGDVVSPSYLQELTELNNVNRWLYLDSKTLNEQEFPAEGLVIEDDSEKQRNS